MQATNLFSSSHEVNETFSCPPCMSARTPMLLFYATRFSCMLFTNSIIVSSLCLWDLICFTADGEGVSGWLCSSITTSYTTENRGHSTVIHYIFHLNIFLATRFLFSGYAHIQIHFLHIICDVLPLNNIFLLESSLFYSF